MRPPFLFVSLTLTFWLGIYAFRSFVPAAIWNLGDELPLSLKPVLAIGTQLAGVIAVAGVLKWRRRSLVPLAFVFALITLTRQIFLASDEIGPSLALMNWVVWLPFMAALADEVAAHDAEALIAPAFASAIGLQLAMQSAWHGLDLHLVSGWLPAAVTALLSVLLIVSVLRSPLPALARPHASAAWFLVGPALFLEMTFVGNAGRLSEILELDLAWAVLIMVTTLLVAIVVAHRIMLLPARIILIVLAFTAALAIPGARGWFAVVILAVQVIIVCGIHGAAERRTRISAASAMTVGGVLFFIVIFAFYNAYELTALWPLTLTALAIPAAVAHRRAQPLLRFSIAAIMLAGALALVGVVPARQTRIPSRTGDTLNVLSYNIHHGFNADGVAGTPEIATTIELLKPDLVALQEIGRGWTVVGGGDVVAYLKWRFPEYQVFFAPLNGQLWGNAIMTRLPVLGVDADVFDAEPGVLRYGWIATHIRNGRHPFTFLSVHLTADLEAQGGDPRAEQAKQLVHTLTEWSRVLVAGDLNANPEDAPIAILTGGLTDLGSAVGLARTPTWPAADPTVRIDYLLGRGFSALTGSVPRSKASDHLPVLLQVRLDDTTATTAPASNRRSP